MKKFENENKIKIENIHKEKDSHILEKESLDKNLNELKQKSINTEKNLNEKITQYKNKNNE